LVFISGDRARLARDSASRCSELELFDVQRMTMPMSNLLVNIDVENLEQTTQFYCAVLRGLSILSGVDAVGASAVGADPYPP
jgi:hypothetical protein